MVNKIIPFSQSVCRLRLAAQTQSVSSSPNKAIYKIENKSVRLCQKRPGRSHAILVVGQASTDDVTTVAGCE